MLKLIPLGSPEPKSKRQFAAAVVKLPGQNALPVTVWNCRLVWMVWIRLMTLNPRSHKGETCESDDHNYFVSLSLLLLLWWAEWWLPEDLPHLNPWSLWALSSMTKVLCSCDSVKAPETGDWAGSFQWAWCYHKVPVGRKRGVGVGPKCRGREGRGTQRRLQSLPWRSWRRRSWAQRLAVTSRN